MLENNNEINLEEEFNSEINYREELGHFLKETRIKNNVEINELASEFIISSQELEEFETGYVDTSNPFFVRLLARKYAKKFDVDNESFVELLDKAYPHINNEYTQVIPELDSMSFNSSIVKKNNKRVVKRVMIYLVSLIFLLILLLSLVVLLTKNVQSVSSNTQNETTLLSTTTLAPSEVIGEKPKTEVVFIGESSINNGEISSLMYDVTQEESAPFEATITAVEDANITIYDENWTIMEDQIYIPKGESYTFDAAGITQLNITADQIQNIEISINGTDIKLIDQNKEGYYLVQINNIIQ